MHRITGKKKPFAASLQIFRLEWDKTLIVFSFCFTLSHRSQSQVSGYGRYLVNKFDLAKGNLPNQACRDYLERHVDGRVNDETPKAAPQHAILQRAASSPAKLG
jgi:hypothetical protein